VFRAGRIKDSAGAAKIHAVIYYTVVFCTAAKIHMAKFRPLSIYNYEPRNLTYTMTYTATAYATATQYTRPEAEPTRYSLYVWSDRLIQL
jgi:hypothetical protein